MENDGPKAVIVGLLVAMLVSIGFGGYVISQMAMRIDKAETRLKMWESGQIQLGPMPKEVEVEFGPGVHKLAGDDGP